VHAALGISQLARVDAYVGRRNELARRYDERLGGLPLRLPHVSRGNRSAFHLYVVRIRDGGAVKRRVVFDELRRRGVGANVHYEPVHLQPYYRALGFREGHCPEAEAYGETAITLPLYPGLTLERQDEVIEALGHAL
jgi:dTDP-4-amino-4,6-dideoxygalactose transaminase